MRCWLPAATEDREGFQPTIPIAGTRPKKGELAILEYPGRTSLQLFTRPCTILSDDEISALEIRDAAIYTVTKTPLIPGRCKATGQRAHVGQSPRARASSPSSRRACKIWSRGQIWQTLTKLNLPKADLTVRFRWTRGNGTRGPMYIWQGFARWAFLGIRLCATRTTTREKVGVRS